MGKAGIQVKLRDILVSFYLPVEWFYVSIGLTVAKLAST